MLKTVVLLNGEIINIGEWDYKYEYITSYDEDDNDVIEKVAQNPFPNGAEIAEMEMEFFEGHGWQVVGFVPPITEIEQIRLEMARGNAELFETIIMLNGGGY